MFKVFAMLLAGVLAAPAMATDISVDNVHQYFLAGERPVKNLAVKNNNKEKAFAIDVKVERVLGIDAKTGKVNLEDATRDFMFAPKQFVLKPNSSKNLRIVYVKPLSENEERRYQMSFMPRIERSYDNDPDATGIQAGASVVVSTGVALMIAPQARDVNMLVKRTEDGAVFKNAGNVTINLRPRINYCDAGSCIDLPKKLVNPGDVWFYKMPKGMKIDWYYDIYGVTQNDVIPVPAS